MWKEDNPFFFKRRKDVRQINRHEIQVLVYVWLLSPWVLLVIFSLEFVVIYFQPLGKLSPMERYLLEVKKYKEVTCKEENVGRPIIK